MLSFRNNIYRVYSLMDQYVDNPSGILLEETKHAFNLACKMGFECDVTEGLLVNLIAVNNSG
jgi:hypothetical protein